MEKVLVTCAHPDDETLGLGGTLKNHIQNGDSIFLLCFSDGQFGRDVTPNGIKQREEQAKKACKTLGIKNYRFLRYADQKLDSVALTELTKNIEIIINKFKPTVFYTHFWGDVNQDHRRVFEASLIAARPRPKSTIDQFICYETPSSTEWGSERFSPNLFVDISRNLSTKISAFKEYKNEIETYPHPRSIEAIKNRASYWGTTVGKKYAEAFIILRIIK